MFLAKHKGLVTTIFTFPHGCKFFSTSSLLTLSQTTNFRLFQSESLQTTILKFSKWVENSVQKGEIAHYEQLLLYPQCFQKTGSADT